MKTINVSIKSAMVYHRKKNVEQTLEKKCWTLEEKCWTNIGRKMLNLGRKNWTNLGDKILSSFLLSSLSFYYYPYLFIIILILLFNEKSLSSTNLGGQIMVAIRNVDGGGQPLRFDGRHGLLLFFCEQVFIAVRYRPHDHHSVCNLTSKQRNLLETNIQLNKYKNQ